MNLALQSPVYFLCKHLFPNHVPIQSRRFCRLCSHLLRHCGRPSHDEQPVKQINKTGSSWIYPKIGSSFSPEHHTNVFQYSNYWNNKLYVIHNLIIWVSEYACKLILDIIIHSKYFPIFDWLKPHAYWIHHNQLLLTKFANNFVIFNRWRQKCSPLQIIESLTEKTHYYLTKREMAAIRFTSLSEENILNE